MKLKWAERRGRVNERVILRAPTASTVLILAKALFTSKIYKSPNNKMTRHTSGATCFFVPQPCKADGDGSDCLDWRHKNRGSKFNRWSLGVCSPPATLQTLFTHTVPFPMLLLLLLLLRFSHSLFLYLHVSIWASLCLPKTYICFSTLFFKTAKAFKEYFYRYLEREREREGGER